MDNPVVVAICVVGGCLLLTVLVANIATTIRYVPRAKRTWKNWLLPPWYWDDWEDKED